MNKFSYLLIPSLTSCLTFFISVTESSNFLLMSSDRSSHIIFQPFISHPLSHCLLVQFQSIICHCVCLTKCVIDAPDDSSAAIPLQLPENHISAANIQTQNNKLSLQKMYQAKDNWDSRGLVEVAFSALTLLVRQLTHVSTIGKKFINSNISPTSLQYGEFEIRLRSFR